MTDDWVFGEKSLEVTLGGIAEEYRPLLSVLMRRLSTLAFFRDNTDYLIGYLGIAVHGYSWCSSSETFQRLGFAVGFVSWKKRRTLRVELTVLPDRKTITVWLENRPGDLRECNWIDCSDFYKAKGFDFDWNVSDERYEADVDRIITTAFKILTVNLADYSQGDEWPYLTDTDLKETSIADLKDRVRAMPFVDQLDSDNRTLLVHAIQALRPDLVSVLLNEGATSDIQPVYLAATLCPSNEEAIVKILEVLFASGKNPDDRTSHESPLEAAARLERFDVVRCLLRHGAKDASPHREYSPAMKQVLSSALSDFRAGLP